MRLFVDNLTNLDFSYLHPKRGLVGETWLANIELIGELDEQGMVCDFGIVKKMMRQWLDTEVDHRLLVATQSPHLLALTQENDDCTIHWKTVSQNKKDSEYEHNYLARCPSEAFCFVDAKEINTQNVAHWCIAQLKPLFPQSIKEIKLSFTIETIEGAFYHYSHGLKKHNGNCQRIAHGHRSRIDIWKDGILDTALMSEWAKKWADIYIGTKEDVIPETAKTLDNTHIDVGLPKNISFEYRSAQGKFYLSIPKSSSYVINTDTTVELIAHHIAQTLKQENPDHTYRVKAYEGLSKGAIIEC